MNKRTIGYLLLLVIMTVLAVAYLQQELMILLAVFLTMPLVSLVFLPMFWIGISRDVKLQLPQTGPVDKALDCQLLLQNKGIFTVPLVQLYLLVDYPSRNQKIRQKLSLSLRGRQETAINIPLTFSNCGSATVEVKKLLIFDIFSIFGLTKRVNQKSEIMILPKMIQIGIVNRDIHMGDIASLDRYHATKSGDDPSELLGVRDYKPGDKLQRIHWKLSAKTEKIMIKEFGSPISCRICIYVDLSSTSEINYQTNMTIVMSLAMSLLEADCIFMLLWNDPKNGMIRKIIFSLEDFYEAFCDLLKTEKNKEIIDVFSLLDELHLAERLKQLICVMDHVSDQEALEYMADRVSFADELFLFSLVEKEKERREETISHNRLFWLTPEELKKQLEKMELYVM